MNRCKYCGKTLSLTNEMDGTCYMCAIEKNKYVDLPIIEIGPNDDHFGEGLIRPFNDSPGDPWLQVLKDSSAFNNIITLTDAPLLIVGHTFMAEDVVWTIIEIDELMEGVVLSDGKNVQLNICHSDKMVYSYNKKGKGIKYLFSFDEIQMINIIIMKLRTHLITKHLNKINTK